MTRRILLVLAAFALASCAHHGRLSQPNAPLVHFGGDDGR